MQHGDNNINLDNDLVNWEAGLVKREADLVHLVADLVNQETDKVKRVFKSDRVFQVAYTWTREGTLNVQFLHSAFTRCHPIH